MKNYIYRLWPLLTYPEVPSYFEAMERRGLRFHHKCHFPYIAAFENRESSRGAERGEAFYCWDYFNSKERVEIQEYLDLCESSGWKIVWQFGKHKVFRGVAERKPTPIWSDDDYRKVLFRRATLPAFLVAVAMLLLLAFCWWMSSSVIAGFAAFLLPVQLYLMTGGMFLSAAVLLTGYKALWSARMAASLKKEFGCVGQPIGDCSPRKVLILTLLSVALYATGFAIFPLFITTVAYAIPNGLGGTFILTLSPLIMWNSYTQDNTNVFFRMDDQERNLTPMKGFRQRKTSWALIAAFVLLLVAAWMSVGHMEQLVGNLLTKNLYCTEIFTDQRQDVISNTYYQAKNQACRDKVLEGIFHREFAAEQQGPVTPSEKDLLTDIVKNGDLHGLLETGNWDEVYDGGYFYTVICRGNEIWCLIDVEDAVGLKDFLRKTGF